MPRPDNVHHFALDLVSLSSDRDAIVARTSMVREADRHRLKSRKRERGMKEERWGTEELLFSLAEKIPQPDLKWKSVAGPRDNSVERRERAGKNVDKLIKKSTHEFGESMNIISDKYLSFADAPPRKSCDCWLRALPDNVVTLPEAWLSRRK